MTEELSVDDWTAVCLISLWMDNRGCSEALFTVARSVSQSTEYPIVYTGKGE